MKTIEDKAEEYLKNSECFSCGTHLCLITKRGHCAVFELYKGRLCNLLKEQQEIDIQRAVEVFAKFAEKYLSFIPPSKKIGRSVKYEAEMFEQAMKGDNQ